MLTEDQSEILDVFGQNSRLSRLYTQLCFCFELPENPEQTNKQAEVVEFLQDGLERLAKAFPWTAGKVVNTREFYEIVPHRGTPELQVVDARKKLPCFREYQTAHYPFRFLGETVVASKFTLPGSSDETAPVLMFKANFVVGGLLLVIDAQHNCMDIRGQGEVIRLFAKACRSEPFSDEELQGKHFGRLETLPKVISAPNSVPGSVNEQAVPSIWSYFLISSEAAKDLKKKATFDLPAGFVSTDDTLTAFTWQSVTRARMYRLPGGQTTTLERQVDARACLDIPSSFIGNVVTKTTHRETAQELIRKPLGVIASELHDALRSRDALAGNTMASATALVEYLKSSDSKTSDRSSLPSTDLKLSSWSKEACCDFNFGGVLGKADAVRRPAFKAWEGLVYFMPKDSDGSIAVALCLRGEDFERLRNDSLFSNYFTYVG
ncbi:hypothetical protein VTO58DRAFT_108295 [Aureobasidium pullulans]|nr:hypothetical protein JADG_008116 [Aureobasidium pullulans]